MSKLYACLVIFVAASCAVDTGPPTEAGFGVDDTVDVPTVLDMPDTADEPEVADAADPADLLEFESDAVASLRQTCAKATLQRLQAEVTRLCKSPGTRLSCKANGTCGAWLAAVHANQACRKARVAVQKQCYGGIWDSGHLEQVRQLDRSVAKCNDLWIRNHCAIGI
jgi:hypothetical protein